MSRAACLAGAVLVLAGGTARAEMCRSVSGESRPATVSPAGTCKTTERLRPYDPAHDEDRGRPGVFRLGPDTEVRIGGRVRVEHDVRR